MLTDAQWMVLGPLIEAVRPAAKVPPRHLRRTTGTTVWRHGVPIWVVADRGDSSHGVREYIWNLSRDPVL